MRRAGIDQVFGRQNLGIKRPVIPQILSPEPLAVDLILMVEFVASRGIESSELPYGLGG